MKYVRLHRKILGATLLIGFLLYFGIPSARGYLLEEDSLVENLSAGFYLMSALYGTFLLLRNQGYKKLITAITSISFLGFLDEVSFGERLFSLNMPYVYGVRIDAAHDFVDVAEKMTSDFGDSYPLYANIIFFGSLFLIISLIIKYKNKLSKIRQKNRQNPPFILLSSFVYLIILALAFDLEIVYDDAFFMMEEIFEMNAALALLMCCFSLKR